MPLPGRSKLPDGKWVNVSVYWRSIAARIEGVRMRAIAQIEAAPDADTAQAAAENFRPL